MKKLSNLIKNLLFCIVFTAIYYIITLDIIFSVFTFLIYLVFFYFIYDLKRNKYFDTLNRTYEAISYMNNFIINLSVTNSVYTTFENMKSNVSDNLKLQIESIGHLDVDTKIEYLNNYFNLPLYGVFINIVKQYIESGTNILEISQLLIHDTRNLEDRLHEFEVNGKRKEKEFLISWGLTFLILVIMKFSLSTLTKNVQMELAIFPLLVLIYFVAFLVVYYVYILNIFDISFIFKGEIYREKVETKIRKAKFKFKKRNNASSNN